MAWHGDDPTIGELDFDDWCGAMEQKLLEQIRGDVHVMGFERNEYRHGTKPGEAAAYLAVMLSNQIIEMRR